MSLRAARRTMAIRARRLRHGVVDPNRHAPALLRRLPRGSVVVAHLEIGEGTGISGRISVKGPGVCSIGRYGALGSEIVIHTGNHPMHRAALQYSLYRSRAWPDGEDATGRVDIGNDVWIGDRALVLPDCVIGNGAVVGAGSIVTRDVAPYSVVAGVPATHLRFRFDPEVIAFLEEIAWWDWSPAEIDGRRAFFEADLTTCSPAALRRLLS